MSRDGARASRFVTVGATSRVACAALVPARGVMGAALVNLLGATPVDLYALRRRGAAEAHRWS